MATADERVDLDALLDLTTPWCLRIAVTLRVADHIAAGVDQIEGLAAATACGPYALHRVLSHLARKGVFREVAPGRFALNSAAEQLSDPSQFLYLEAIGAAWRAPGRRCPAACERVGPRIRRSSAVRSGRTWQRIPSSRPALTP